MLRLLIYYFFFPNKTIFGIYVYEKYVKAVITDEDFFFSFKEQKVTTNLMYYYYYKILERFYEASNELLSVLIFNTYRNKNEHKLFIIRLADVQKKILTGIDGAIKRVVPAS